MFVLNSAKMPKRASQSHISTKKAIQIMAKIKGRHPLTGVMVSQSHGIQCFTSDANLHAVLKNPRDFLAMMLSTGAAQVVIEAETSATHQEMIERLCGLIEVDCKVV